MEAISCLISRRSVREYTREPLSQQEIENVVETSQMASCWENTQPIRYIAVLDEDLKNRIADECTKKFPWNTENIHEAPALIILCAIKGLSGYEPDGTPSTTKRHPTGSPSTQAWQASYLCVAANALELGTLRHGPLRTKQKSKKYSTFRKTTTYPASLPSDTRQSSRQPTKENHSKKY
ncbi:nitroreductase family protein [Dialister sp.]|uniref:nitroreductase family protein n=1 Tax=Dialister sp. TaxID=1955814 RepID=UPI00406D513E